MKSSGTRTPASAGSVASNFLASALVGGFGALVGSVVVSATVSWRIDDWLCRKLGLK